MSVCPLGGLEWPSAELFPLPGRLPAAAHQRLGLLHYSPGPGPPQPPIHLPPFHMHLGPLLSGFLLPLELCTSNASLSLCLALGYQSTVVLGRAPSSPALPGLLNEARWGFTGERGQQGHG